MKRRPAVERSDIGVWNHIFFFISFIALVINIAILIFASNGFKEFLEIETNKKYDPYSIAIILIILEHLLFLVKFSINMLVSNKPKWVKEYLDDQEYKKRLDVKKMKQKVITEKIHVPKNRRIKKSVKNLLEGISENCMDKETSNLDIDDKIDI